MLSERAVSMDNLCSAVPGAVTGEVLDQLEEAGIVSVINETTADAVGDYNLGGAVNFDMIVAHSRVSRASGGQLFETVKIMEASD